MKRIIIAVVLVAVVFASIWAPTTLVLAIEVLDSMSKAQSGEVFFASPFRVGPKELLTGVNSEDRVAIHGVLAMPDISGGKVPAVVVLHTSLGVRPHVQDAAKALNKAGIAAFIVDSHSPRGGKFSVEQARNLIPTRTADAYAALNLLATHPLIDSSRIAVMGYSSGAAAALFATSRHVRQAMTGGRTRFAAHIAWYPHCWRQLARPDATGAPVLMLLAQEDNLTPIVQCQDFGQRIGASGAAVRSMVYAGAYHAFDFPMLAGKVIKSKTLLNVSKCVERVFLLQADGTWFAPSLNRRVTNLEEFGDVNQDCSDGYANAGGPPGTAEKATRDMLAFLREVFRIAERR